MKKIFRLLAVLIALLFVIPSLYVQTYAATGSSADGFTVIVDYYEECLKIIPFAGTDIIEVGTQGESAKYNNTGEGVQYMYALKSVSDEMMKTYENNPKKIASLLAKDKWYPIYNGEISIEKSIPKKPVTDPKKTYYIAIREANDIFTGNYGYTTRIVVPIKSRLYDKNLKKLLEYDADNEEYKLSSLTAFSDAEIMYSFDNFGYNSIRLARNSGSLKVPAEYYFNGGVIKIKTAPIVTNGNVQYASSAVIKYTIPRAGATPSVKSDASKYALASLKKDKIEWALSKESTSWTTYSTSATAVYYKDFKEVFGIDFAVGTDSKGNPLELVTKDEQQYYVIYFRTKSVKGKTPASPAKAIYISRAEAESVLQ